jgi:hypothetical protein
MLTLDENCAHNAVNGNANSRLAHLVGALRGRHNPEKTIVAVLTGYFDASGAPDQGSVLVVSGFIAFESFWLEFEDRWNAVLRDAGITCFHMNEFINCKGEFEGWKQKQKKRERLLEKLGGIIVRTVLRSYACVVVLEDWNKANQEYELAENDLQPYALAGWDCVLRILGWSKDHLYNPLFVFEHGDKHQFSLIRRVDQDLGVIIRTGLKKPNAKKPNEPAIVQLQSADFAAWQILNLNREFEAGYRRTHEIEQVIEPWLWATFNRLFVAVPYDHGNFSLQKNRPWDRYRSERSSLVRLCEDYHVARRIKSNGS